VGLLIKYEDFVADPATWTEKIGQHIGLPVTPEPVQHRIAGASVERSERVEPDFFDRWLLRRITEKELKCLGY
jgi:hypothetical protein